MHRFFFTAWLLLTVFLMAVSQTPAPNSTDDLKDCKQVALETSLGRIVVALYNETPQHRDNFLKLVNQHFYDGVLFHRVIKDFMVQTGDPDSRTATPGQQLGGGDPGYTLPAEIVFPQRYHKRGALAAARTPDQVNPERRSSGSQFYIVTGKVATIDEMQRYAQNLEQVAKHALFNKLAQQHVDTIRAMYQRGDTAGLDSLQTQLVAQMEADYAAAPVAYSAQQVQTYTTQGGTPFLDGQYTVFGEVVEGMDVVNKIQEAECDPSDRPKQDIKILSATVLN